MEKEFFDKVFYIHPEKIKVKKIVSGLEKSLEKTFSDKKFDKKIIIFGHSFGGVLAKTAISKLSKKNREKIILVTMGTPHSMKYGMVGEIREYLKTPDDLKNTKVFSFGGIYDTVVPAKFAHTKNSVKVDFLCWHMMFLYSKKILENIFKEIFLD